MCVSVVGGEEGVDACPGSEQKAGRIRWQDGVCGRRLTPESSGPRVHKNRHDPQRCRERTQKILWLTASEPRLLASTARFPIFPELTNKIKQKQIYAYREINVIIHNQQCRRYTTHSYIQYMELQSYISDYRGPSFKHKHDNEHPTPKMLIKTTIISLLYRQRLMYSPILV